MVIAHCSVPIADWLFPFALAAQDASLIGDVPRRPLESLAGCSSADSCTGPSLSLSLSLSLPPLQLVLHGRLVAGLVLCSRVLAKSHPSSLARPTPLPPRTSSHSISTHSIPNRSLPPFPTTLAPAVITLCSGRAPALPLFPLVLPTPTAANELFDRLINTPVRDARPRTRGVSSHLATSHPPLYRPSRPSPSPLPCLARTSHRRHSILNRSLPLHLTYVSTW
ncbi:hypothetical protein B0H14DRAFT_3649058 [Mycena olivaceomarginata]|nr:hypothetical protein B0H14DRAFT_3649058 [Mycena olivaceomarginata]